MYTGMTIVKGVSAVGTVVNTGTVDTWIPMNSCLQSQSKVDADKRGKWRGDKYAYLWTSQFRGAGSYYIATHMRMNATKIITHNHWNNAYGFGVRCVQEIH